MLRYIKKFIGTIALFLPAALWLILIFRLSEQNGERTAQLSWWLVERIYRRISLGMTMDEMHLFLRKLAHVCVFAGEGFLIEFAIWNCLRPMKPRKGDLRHKKKDSLLKRFVLSTFLSALMCAPMAVFDEWRKTFIEGRHCHWDEVRLNVIGFLFGIGVAAVLFMFFSAIYRAMRRPKSRLPA